MQYMHFVAASTFRCTLRYRHVCIFFGHCHRFLPARSVNFQSYAIRHFRRPEFRKRILSAMTMGRKC
uniref:Secreted protein n=1 Tax=Trichuris muris TaxID=70415 RepID=A0A5S6R3K7_TRIMR